MCPDSSWARGARSLQSPVRFQTVPSSLSGAALVTRNPRPHAKTWVWTRAFDCAAKLVPTRPPSWRDCAESTHEKNTLARRKLVLFALYFRLRRFVQCRNTEATPSRARDGRG